MQRGATATATHGHLANESRAAAPGATQAKHQLESHDVPRGDPPGGSPRGPPGRPRAAYIYNHDVVRNLFWVRNPNRQSNLGVSKPNFGFRKSSWGDSGRTFRNLFPQRYSQDRLGDPGCGKPILAMLPPMDHTAAFKSPLLRVGVPRGVPRAALGSLYIQPRCGSKLFLGEEPESAIKTEGFQAQLWFQKILLEKYVGRYANLCCMPFFASFVRERMQLEYV